MALGFIETRGIASSIEASDVMCKEADVELIAFENIGSGYTTTIIKGDVAAVKSSVINAVKSVESIGGEVILSNVIANPHKDIEKIIVQHKLV